MIKNYLQELNITGSLIDEKNVQKIIDLIEKTILKKKTIFVCGNGGSSAIASHTLCDWVKRLHPLVNCKIYDLTTNKSLISAISNDISHDEIFSYYKYMGSMTSPPCAENVVWFVASETVP